MSENIAGPLSYRHVVLLWEAYKEAEEHRLALAKDECVITYGVYRSAFEHAEDSYNAYQRAYSDYVATWKWA